jgi:hypothetical protein
MGLKNVLDVVAERGLSLYLAEDGSPRLRGPRSEITPALVEALRAYREEIIVSLQPVPPPPRREFRWADGHTRVECANDEGFGRPDWSPFCAWWWRYEGEADWQTLPHRTPDASIN